MAPPSVGPVMVARPAYQADLDLMKRYRGHKGDRFRSIPLSLFAPLAQIEGVQLVSLQKGHGCEQIEQCKDTIKLLEWSDPSDMTAEAPPDEADLASMAVAELVHQIDHRALHAVAQAEVAALTPAADGVAAVLQEAAQRARRGVGSDEPGQHQHRMAVTSWGQAEKRQRAKKRAKLVEGPPLQKHQSFGRRAQRLGSRGHRSSSLGRPLAFRQPADGPIEGRKTRRIVPQCNNFIKAKEPLLPFQAAHLDAAAFKNLAVIK